MIQHFWSMTIFLYILILFTGCSGSSGGGDNSGGLPTTPVDNKPPVFIKINKINIQENTIDILKVIANDPENDGLSYSLDAAAADSALLNIGESSGNLIFKIAPDFEVPLDEGNDNTYETRINISDGSNTVSFALKIIVSNTGPNTPINTAPTVTKAHFEIAENNLVIGKIVASDKEEDSIVFYSKGGVDAEKLVLRGSGTLEFYYSAPSFEKPKDDNLDNVYEMSVSMGDGNLFIYFDITVTVIDANDLPVITSNTKILSEENNVFVQQLTVTDEDSTTFTYSITGGPDAALFEFTQSGVLNFVDAPIFNDPSHANGYNVSIEVSDGIDTQTATLDIYVVEKIAEFDTTFGDIDPNNTDQRLGYIYQDSAFSTTRSRDTANDVAVLSNKKLIVVGKISGTSTMSYPGMAVWRYTDQGVLDTDLNTGFGPVDPDDSSRRLGYVYHNTNAGGDTRNEGYGVAITSNDKIVVVGLSRSSTSTDSVVWQFTTDGQLDTTFGAIDSNNVGQRLGYTVSALPGRDRANSVVIGADGSIFVAGTSHVNASDDMALWKYTPLGDLDASFGRIDPTDNLKRLGYVTHNNAGGSSGRSSKDDSGTDLALTQTGNIIVVGCSDTDAKTFTWCQLVVWSFTADGKLNTNPDTGFGHFINANSDRWGYFVLLRSGDWSGAKFGSATAVSITTDNKIVVVGSQGGGMAILRITEYGIIDQNIDTGFGPIRSSGSIRYGYNSLDNIEGGLSNGKSNANDVDIMSDNRIIVVGSSEFGSAFNDYSALWRFTKDGILEGHNFHIESGETVYSDAHSVIVTDSNEIITSGSSYSRTGSIQREKESIKRFVSIN